MAGSLLTATLNVRNAKVACGIYDIQLFALIRDEVGACTSRRKKLNQFRHSNRSTESQENLESTQVQIFCDFVKTFY